MDLGLTGKVVLVTGAGSGIGLACAQVFASEGAFVYGADLLPDALKEIGGPNPPRAAVVDATIAKAVDAWVERSAAEHGRVDVLVNAVGVAPIREGFLGTSHADWMRTIEVNVLSAVAAIRSVLPRLVSGGGGAIVTIASDVARQPSPSFVDYSVSKAALVNLSKSLSIEFGPAGVRANCVSPGPTLTPPVVEMLRHNAQRDGTSFDQALEVYVRSRQLPLRRLNDPVDVANAVAFLASDAARQITGSVVAVDAGLVLAL